MGEMNQEDSQQALKTRMIRVAVWGQAIGFVVSTVILALEDAPDYFGRVSATNVIWPVALVLAMHTLRLDKIAAQHLSTALLVLLILLPSLVSALGTLAGAVFFARIPPLLSTEEDAASAVGLSVAFLVFAIALTVNVVMALKVFQSKNRA